MNDCLVHLSTVPAHELKLNKIGLSSATMSTQQQKGNLCCHLASTTAEGFPTCGPELAAPLSLLIDHTLQVLLGPEACLWTVICLCYLMKHRSFSES